MRVVEDVATIGFPLISTMRSPRMSTWRSGDGLACSGEMTVTFSIRMSPTATEHVNPVTTATNACNGERDRRLMWARFSHV